MAGYTDLDSVRFLLGDTDESEVLLNDEEINFLIDQWASKGTIYYTASMGAEAIAARFAREVSVNSDSQTLSTSELQQKYLDLAGRLRMQHNQLLSGGNVDAGGMNAGERPDPTVAPLSFGTRMHDNPEAGQQDFGDWMDFGGYGWSEDELWGVR